MRRLMLAVALAALLAVALILPAMAQTSPTEALKNNILPTLKQAPLLSGLLDSSANDEEIIEPIVFSDSERPGISSSSLNPSSSISSNSNTSNPNTSNPDSIASQEFSERRIQSGSASPSFSVNDTGDNANICPTGQQVVNTGNAANQQGVTQYNSATDDTDLTGDSITVDSSVSVECTQTIEQAGTAGK